MFSLNKCLVRACHNLSISSVDENGQLSTDKCYCLDHSPNPGKLQKDIYLYIMNNDKIVGLNASGMTFMGIENSTAVTSCTQPSQTAIQKD